MNYKVIVSPIASKNIEDAVAYYIEKATKKVAFDFLKAYKKIYKALQINPFYQFHDNRYLQFVCNYQVQSPLKLSQLPLNLPCS